MKAELEFDPRLMEEAVPLALKGSPEQRAFHREREKAYAVVDPEERDRSFFDVHSRWFRKLGLADPVRWAIREAGEGLSGVSRWLVTRAISERQSGAELFVAEGTRRSVVVRILPAALVDRDRALSFLRREFLHIADMLDPAFEYQPRLPHSPLGPSEDRRIRDRYAVLWRCSVEGRLARAGSLPPKRRDRCLSDFHQMFACLGDETGECFEKIFSGERPLHSVFVALATEPEVAFGLNRPSRERGRRCPLCGFPTIDFDPDAESLAREVLEEIRLDFASWKVDQGLCRQCADLYRALASSDHQADPGAVRAARSPARTP